MPKSTRTEERYSLCVGINRYTSSLLSTLQYAEDDARAMDECLGQLGFAAENRLLLLGEAATLDAVNKALAEIILDRPHENDLVVFYYAGHSKPLIVGSEGAQSEADSRSEVFLTSYDFDQQKIQHSRSFRHHLALGMERLRKDFFEGEGSRKRLFLFDSCYSGNFYGPRYRDEADPVQGYIKHMLNSTSLGRVALLSCLPVQQAVEVPGLGHGRFTYYLLSALTGKAPEALRHNGCLTVSSLFEYVASQLPAEQRPVLCGVQQDVFELVCYPESVGPNANNRESFQENRLEEKEKRLRALFADHRGFMRDRLTSFVGRQAELSAIRQRISEKQQTGGYVTITGQAGQGKSSIIVKLVDDFGPENTAFHFIPINPGPDHQVGLLRNLMSRLIFKYDLSDIYVASDSRPALRDYFPKVLAEVAAKGGQEVIFIDGLDQLEEDFTGFRDLSFLPNNPPKGIVFVLGTRPNDTLRPLELLKPHQEYKLPNLSRKDFDLILLHRQVKLDRDLADQFYQAMQENALYLDLVAQELMNISIISPKEIIERLANNPENLFSLSMARLKRQPLEWREVIKPILGLLLVAQAPFSVPHIRQILRVEDDRLRDGIVRLGGLIATDGQQNYTLFHLKLRDYLRQDNNNPQKEYIFAKDEEESWNKNLADWSEGGNLSSIWQDVASIPVEQKRREYARWHYVTHLYYAHEWGKLFDVLDAAQYGQEKVRFDPSIRPYVQDLDLGRQAAALEERDLQEGIKFLPHLWRYTLLRCSLSSRAETYPPEVFESLILLNRYQQAINLAELLTSPNQKARTLLQIVEPLAQQVGREQEFEQLILRVYEVSKLIENDKMKAGALYELSRFLAHMHRWEMAETVISTIGMSLEKVKALSNLGTELIKAQQWERAEATICSIEVNWERDWALRELAIELGKAQQWKRSKEVIRLIENTNDRAKALVGLGEVLLKAQHERQANEVWEQAIAMTSTLGSELRASILKPLLIILINEQQFWRVEEMLHLIENTGVRDGVLRDFGVALAKAQQWERAEAAIFAIKASWERDNALGEVGIELAKAQMWDKAEATLQKIKGHYQKAQALQRTGLILSKAQLWEEAISMAEKIEINEIKAKALNLIGIELIEGQQLELARAVWNQAVEVTDLIQQRDIKTEVFRELAVGLIAAQQLWGVESVVDMIEVREIKIEVLRELAIALTAVERWDMADLIWTKIEDLISEIGDSRDKAIYLVQMGKSLNDLHQRKRAETLWEKVPFLLFKSEGRNLMVEALTRQMSEFVKAEQWELAEAVALAIPGSYAQSRALEELGQAVIKLKQWTRAEAIVHIIKESIIRDRLIQVLFTELIAVRQWDRIEALICLVESLEVKTSVLSWLVKELRIARQTKLAKAVDRLIKQNADKTDQLLEASGLASLVGYIREVDHEKIARPGKIVLEKPQVVKGVIEEVEEICKLGVALTNTKEWERAEECWGKAEKLAASIIIKPSERAEALRILSTSLAKVQQWKRSEAIIHTITINTIMKRALRELGIELVKAHQWKYAELVANKIGNNEDKAALLLGMVKVHKSIEEFICILHLIQISWRQADTTAYAIDLLSMISGLFSLDSDIIKSFCESFTWVDAFLRRSIT